jgi:hypothetical protein
VQARGGDWEKYLEDFAPTAWIEKYTTDSSSGDDENVNENHEYFGDVDLGIDPRYSTVTKKKH